MKEKYNRFVLRKCVEQDINLILELQKNIIDSLDDKEILRENTRVMFEHCMQHPNLTIGLFDDFELIALAIFADEQGKEEDLSLDLVNHSVTMSANLKLVMVKKEYRGNGLQKALMWILEKYAFNCGFTHLCTTVSDKNIYSIRNVREVGYEFDHSAIKYGGMHREIFVKNIEIDVSSYNRQILNVIGSCENKVEPNSLIMEGINLDRCFRGEFSIANTGDILEYEDTDSGNIYYGLLIKKFTPMVLIFIPEKKCLKLVEFCDSINSLKLQKIWINAIGGK